jgi:hypothetical protein
MNIISLALNVPNVLLKGTGASILLPLGVMAGFALLGLIDDWEGIQSSRGQVGLGLSPRIKFAAQVILAGIAAALISLYGGGFSGANQIILPLIPIRIPINPVFFIPLAAFIIVAMSNAVNFTDGLDGLAGIITASAFAAYGVIAFIQGQIFLVQLCFIMVERASFCGTRTRRSCSGDTGSLALGATSERGRERARLPCRLSRSSRRRDGQRDLATYFSARAGHVSSACPAAPPITRAQRLSEIRSSSALAVGLSAMIGVSWRCCGIHATARSELCV